ncbi:hypothetical protein BD324DRAFT_647732 [Kockovaella imperatae]|uniref:Uncharacterized protein n=1 Tax=Kockovaella imperatae TaxID=4999 RepID=A0A1Y1UTT0_9TREE|nr:hypothetical protein BD324DRAFT_647732 [Kockovaella imperatae]ORX40826.1 hypothetical protein BD324DRAFT_647732 [Kockovaella imperatae]
MFGASPTLDPMTLQSMGRGGIGMGIQPQAYQQPLAQSTAYGGVGFGLSGMGPMGSTNSVGGGTGMGGIGMPMMGSPMGGMLAMPGMGIGSMGGMSGLAGGMPGMGMNPMAMRAMAMAGGGMGMGMRGALCNGLVSPWLRSRSHRFETIISHSLLDPSALPRRHRGCVRNNNNARRVRTPALRSAAFSAL